MMKLHWEPITLDLKTTFRVAHGASDERHNVLVYLDEGVGEAAAVPYYGETQPGIIDYLRSVPDLWGKKLGQPLYKLLGLDPNRVPLTSFTIGMDEPEVMAEQARSCGYPILK